jgi:hypothetical protein
MNLEDRVVEATDGIDTAQKNLSRAKDDCYPTKKQLRTMADVERLLDEAQDKLLTLCGEEHDTGVIYTP